MGERSESLRGRRRVNVVFKTPFNGFRLANIATNKIQSTIYKIDMRGSEGSIVIWISGVGAAGG